MSKVIAIAKVPNRARRIELQTRIVTLTNGKRVANFSSPHPFTFEDGTILPSVSNAEATYLCMDAHELLHDNGDIEMSFKITDAIRKEMQTWLVLHDRAQVDVVFVPLPMLMMLKAQFPDDYRYMPFRSIRCVDRITKAVSISRQCI